MAAQTNTLATFGGDVATQSSPAGVITSMLKEYLPYEMLFEELIKRDYLLTKVDKDQSWKGGELSVPFMGGKASSFAYGQLTAVDDITEDRPVRGKVTEYREIWGSMIFHQKDLDTHTDMAQSFLKILPDRLEDFIERMKEAVSINLLNGPHFDIIDFAGSANLAIGKIKVKRISRFQLGQYVELGELDEGADTGNLKYAGYVRSIDVDTEEIELVAEKDVFTTVPAATLIDFTAHAVIGEELAATDRVYLRGVLGEATPLPIDAAGENPQAGVLNTVRRGFTSLRSQLLSNANGGSANLFGIPKTTYPHLQAVQVNGSGILTDMLGGVFDANLKIRQLGKGNPTDAIMSYSNLAIAMKQLEEGAGGAVGTNTRGRQFTATDTKVNSYGWTEVTISGFGGSLTFVGVHEMDDDAIYLMDWRSLKMFSNGFFERRQAPDGKEYYEERTTAGYKYVIDTRFYGELVLSKPSHCGVIHTLTA